MIVAMHASRSLRSLLIGCIAPFLPVALIGCFSPPRESNPSFPVSVDAAHRDFERMRADPKPAARSVIIIGGIADPSISSESILAVIAPTLKDTTVVEVDFFGTTTFAEAREHLFQSVRAGLHLGAEDAIPEVDVIAFSMGGLVARDAACTKHGGERIPIRQLYTISTPHLGARVASVPFQFPQSADMQITSDFLVELDEELPNCCYELHCYAVTDDVTVGEEFAAPAAWPLWWVPVQPGQYGHFSGFTDERILSDIARRLRGEPTVTCFPASPLPY